MMSTLNNKGLGRAPSALEVRYMQKYKELKGSLDVYSIRATCLYRILHPCGLLSARDAMHIRAWVLQGAINLRLDLELLLIQTDEQVRKRDMIRAQDESNMVHEDYLELMEVIWR